MRTRSATLIIMPFLIAGCAAQPVRPANTAIKVNEMDDAVSLWINPQGASEEEAILRGHLEIENRCLVAKDDAGESSSLIFPKGSEYISKHRSVRLPDLRELIVGEIFTASGGARTFRDSEEAAAHGAPSGCPLKAFAINGVVER